MPTTIDGSTGVSQVQDGSIQTADLAAGAVTPPKLSGGQGGNPPVFGARAWCVFNGALTGTNTPVAGGNVASITRVGVGRYLGTLSVAMPNADYSVGGTTLPADANSYSLCMDQAAAPTTTQFSIRTTTQSATLTDVSRVHLQVFG